MRTLGLVAMAALLVSCGRPPRAERATTPARAAAIDWQPWGLDVFERARREDRLILVDVGIEGCTACRWMYEDTYQHPDVVRRVEARFIAVAVDADAQPDLGERWQRWGWPATIVLTPSGEQILALRGNRRPRNFVPILDELIERHAAGTLTTEDPAPIEVAADAPDELGVICGSAVARMRELAREPGYGTGMQHAAGKPVRWEILRGRARDEEARTAHALETLAGYSEMIDPVWGGIFVAARPGFVDPIPEKRTIHQAPVLAALAEAHLQTGDARWLEEAAGIDRYLREWMRAEDGTFFATQEDEAPSLPRGMSASDYYALPDAERRRYGIPPIDHAVYTDLNALVIEAYVRLYQATGDAAHLELAVRAAEVLLRERQRPEGWMAQTAGAALVRDDERMRDFVADERAFLKPQGPFGLALLALHSATGEARWLEAASRVAAGMSRLEDAERGGYFASDASSTDAVLGRRKPLAENLQAARFLNRLGWATHDTALREHARRTVLSVLPEIRVDRLTAGASLVAQAIEELLYGPVDLTVLGAPDDPAARALFEAAQRAGEPRGVVRYERAGVRYPDQGRAAMFICSDTACSSPIFDTAEVAATAARMGRVDEPAPCTP